MIVAGVCVHDDDDECSLFLFLNSSWVKERARWCLHSLLLLRPFLLSLSVSLIKREGFPVFSLSFFPSFFEVRLLLSSCPLPFLLFFFACEETEETSRTHSSFFFFTLLVGWHASWGTDACPLTTTTPIRKSLLHYTQTLSIYLPIYLCLIYLSICI